MTACAACVDLGGLAGARGEDEDAGIAGRKDSGAPRTDGGGDAQVVEGAARCDPSKPFGAPELVTLFDPTADFVKGAILSHDELEAFYLRYAGSGNWDLRHARRAKRSDAFAAVETMNVTPSPDGFLSLTAAGLKLYFWTLENNFRAKRAGTNEAFGTPVKYDVASGPMTFFVDADDTAYFAKTQADAGFEKLIVRATVNSGGFSTVSTVLPNIHVAGALDDRPVLNTSETAMYFASNRAGGKGLADVWVSRRASKQVELGLPVHVPELSTDEPDAVTWVSNDECEVFLDRASHVYRASRPL